MYYLILSCFLLNSYLLPLSCSFVYCNLLIFLILFLILTQFLIPLFPIFVLAPEGVFTVMINIV